MSQMREGSVRCLDPHGFHVMRYVEWGDPNNKRVLVCVHGLTRQGRDFDYLAASLADAYRVVCPDVVGRGRSDWLRDPMDYNYNVYCADMATLIASLHAETLDWVGTSMGGIIGMALAAMPGTPLRKLVLNDVGCVVPASAIERIGEYVGSEPAFDSLDELEKVLRATSPFGDLTDAQRRHLSEHCAKEDGEGRWRFRYDPAIAKVFAGALGKDIDLRPYWSQVRGPVLVIRGETSDLLTPEVFEEMRGRPRTESLLVPRTGHVPMLMDDAQVGPIRRFLLS
jgi:pimeloyl-ACP methyl ester carboxylesterase